MRRSSCKVVRGSFSLGVPLYMSFQSLADFQLYYGVYCDSIMSVCEKFGCDLW